MIFFFPKTLFSQLFREETEIIEGEVVEIQIDRPASGTVGYSLFYGDQCILQALLSSYLITFEVDAQPNQCKQRSLLSFTKCLSENQCRVAVTGEFLTKTAVYRR